METSEDERERIQRACTRFLTHRQRPQQVFSELAAFTVPELEEDHYGERKLISGFEQKIAISSVMRPLILTPTK
jgi:hypothetical protein